MGPARFLCAKPLIIFLSIFSNNNNLNNLRWEKFSIPFRFDVSMAAFTKSSDDSTARSMREIVQKKFLDDVLGEAGASSSGWMILVLDDRATRVISSALSMYDVMERRITLVSFYL